MRVLYLYMFPLWGNGSGTWLRRLTSSLNDKYKKHFEAAIVAPESRDLEGIKIYRLKPPLMGVFVGNPELTKGRKYSSFSNLEMIETYNYYFLQAAKAIEDFKPDFIHVWHTAFLPALARPLSNFYKVPFGITTHGSDLYYFKEDSRWIPSVQSASEKSKFISANSNFTKVWYLQMFGVNLIEKTRVIPSGINQKIDFKRDVSWIDKKYKFKHDKMVLFTGRLTIHKGVEYLIRAARQINAEVLILGDGPERKYLESLIKQYNLTNVHMLGYFSERVEQINDFYLRADVYVAPSVWNEPLGLVILESMAQKTPVVVTRKGGVSTIVKDGYNGFLVRPKSWKEIVEKVNLLLANDALRNKMGENAYKTVAARFSWDKIATRFYNLYERYGVKR